MTEQIWAQRATLVCPHLWVSEAICRGDENQLRLHGIAAVVSLLTAGQDNDPRWPKCSLPQRTFNFDDHATLTVETMKQIQQQIDEFNVTGPVLLHCVSGANRSTCIALAHLVTRDKLHPIVAWNRYNQTRGASIAALYNVPPRMSLQMERNLVAYLEAEA